MKQVESLKHDVWNPVSQKMKQSRTNNSVSARVTQSPALYWSLQNLLIPFELHRRTSSSSLNWGPLALQPTPSRNKRGSQMYGALTLMSLLSYSNIIVLSILSFQKFVGPKVFLQTTECRRSFCKGRGDWAEFFIQPGRHHRSVVAFSKTSWVSIQPEG